MEQTKELNYKKAFHILMDHFDLLPQDDKEEIDKKLKECGL